MHAYVYKSLKRADTYVFLAARDDFERLPETLRAELGPLRFVLEVALTPGRKLARTDADTVREHLAVRGFHLQLPPQGVDDLPYERWGRDV
ncbi:YcgL domain-containing protein [Vulcaniibacterium gelatinicum]|uniref:YcgL domain-containing protein n=1 Tax=Vulcaniibacterium gelatinicum TaxID=2598725 RepID=UPI0011CC7484|nr:YcgL domain-containing protein [Vulcaniibacterium gelatinicum]